MANDGTIFSAAKAIRDRWAKTPSFGLILGTGWGQFVDQIVVDERIPFSSIPGFPLTSALGHQGELICGQVGRCPVVILNGRTHCYEGRTYEEIVRPVRVLAELGLSCLMVTCAAGGLSPRLQCGDVMVIHDQVESLNRRQSAGEANDCINRPGLKHCYDEALISLLLELGRQRNVPLQMGSYVSVTGPNYETKAEMRYYRLIADAIGMSTTPEATTAGQLGIRVCGLATITNLCHPDALTVADGHEVVDVATQAEARVRDLVLEFIQRVAE